MNIAFLMLVGVPWSWINSSPQGDLIIDPTTNAATNEDVRLYDAGNYGSDTKLAVGKFPNAGQWKSRSLISFNLTGIPSNATVLNAQMKLKYYEKYNNSTGTWVDRWIQAHQLLVSWDEAQADSLKRLTGVNWGAARGKIGSTNPDANGAYESTLLIVEDEVLPVWKSWDLTALTQKWVSGAVANYGVILWATNENTSGYVLRFYSSEATNTSDRPYLEVVWSNTPKTVYFLKDHLGSIRATVLDSTGAPLVGFDDYDAWGYPLATRTKAIPNAYLQGASKNKFTGSELEDDYGLNWYYFLGRRYIPEIGRWVVVDPLFANNPGLSPYHYARNNPISRIDPMGLDDYYYNRRGEQVGYVDNDDDDRHFVQDSKGKQSYNDNQYVQFTGNIFNATDADGGEGKVVAAVAGEEKKPPTPEDAVVLNAGEQTDSRKAEYDFYKVDSQVWKVPNGFRVIVTPDGKPKIISITGLQANAHDIVLGGPRMAYDQDKYILGIRTRANEVSWVNDIVKRISERKPELKPFIRSTR